MKPVYTDAELISHYEALAAEYRQDAERAGQHGQTDLEAKLSRKAIGCQSVAEEIRANPWPHGPRPQHRLDAQ